MKQEYSIAIGWKIFMYIFCAGIIGIVGYFFIDAISTSSNVPGWTGGFLAAIAFSGYTVLSLLRSKLIVTDDSIIDIGTFTTKQLLFSEVRGYKVFNNSKSEHLTIISKVAGKPNIRIGDPAYIGKGRQLYDFIRGKFIDLDQVAYDTELTEILDDPTIGATTTDRERYLATAKKYTGILNAAGGVVTFWVFIYPHPYPLPLYIAMVIPLIAILFFFKEQEVVNLVETQKRSAYPALTFALIMPALGLFIRALLQYDLLDYNKCVTPVAILFAVFAFLFIVFIRKSKNKVTNVFAGLFFAAIYSYSAIVSANGLLDNSQPTAYTAKVLDQHISSGKSTTYYLTLSAWGPKAAGHDESVARSLYNEVKTGDVVTVYVKKGTFNIPWYFIDK